MILLKPSAVIEDLPPGDEVLTRIERAARTCYKSDGEHKDAAQKQLRDPKFLPGDPNDSRRIMADRRVREDFVHKLLKMGHESTFEHVSATVRFIVDRGCCYHPDTLVLTVEGGWKKMSDVQEGEEVFTLTDDGQMIPIRPVHKIEQDFDGELVEIESKQVSLSVTPNHNCWVFDHEKRSPATRTWKFLRADELTNNRYQFEKSCKAWPRGVVDDPCPTIILPALDIPRGFWTETLPERSFSAEPFWELVGLWATDGSITFGTNGCGHRLSISQTKKRVCARIEALLSELGLEYTRQSREYRIKSPQLLRFLYMQFMHDFAEDWGSARKSYYLRVPRMLAKFGPTNWVKAFLRGVVLGDGGEYADGRVQITTVSEGFAQDLVELYLKVGRAANYYPNGKPGRKHTGVKPGQVSEIKVQAYTVDVLRELQPMIHTKKAVKRVPYKGKVVCLELPEHHRLYVMRNGKAVWCGNSHELVRHRLAAYSQESTRYVDYTREDKSQGHCQFVIPPWCKIEPGTYTTQEDDAAVWVLKDGVDVNLDPQSHAWVCAMAQAERFYQALRKTHNWSPQQARGVLPNSTKTEIVMTANMREFRHLFQLRTSKAAHPQMREVMFPLLEEFRQRVPVLFDDIHPDDQ